MKVSIRPLALCQINQFKGSKGRLMRSDVTISVYSRKYDHIWFWSLHVFTNNIREACLCGDVKNKFTSNRINMGVQASWPAFRYQIRWPGTIRLIFFALQDLLKYKLFFVLGAFGNTVDSDTDR